MQYFLSGLYVDLADLHSNARDGVHIASTGGVWNALVSIEHVDQWVVRRNLVDPQTWDQLVTARLGAPITINNIPAGLFRDFTGTSWTGFLWGWQLSGTDEIRLTVIDKRLFKL